jgi:hypothetical protein
MVTLCLAVLVGLGLAGLARGWPRPAGRRARVLLLPLLVAGLLVEHLALPYPLERPDAPSFYRELARSPEAGTILEWPFSLKRSRSLYYQTVHGRPMVGGYISRRLAYPLRGLPPFRTPPSVGSEIVLSAPPPDLGAWALAHADVRWIVVLLDDPYLDREELPQFLARYAESAPLYQDERTAVYRPLPPSGDPPAYLALGGGWHALEWPEGGRSWNRWFASAGGLTAWSFAPGPRAYRLRFAAWSYHQPRRLAVAVDGQPVGEWAVERTGRFDIPLTLDYGVHRIELRSLDPPVSPALVGEAAEDMRPLAFNVWDLELVR